MKRYIGLVAITAAVMIGLLLFLFRGYWLNDPLSAEESLSYPQYGVQSADGTLYVVDSAQRRVVQILPDGGVGYRLTGGSRAEGSFFYVQDIAVDDDGYLYLLNYVLDTGGMFMEREEIQRFTPTGRYDGTVYRRTYQDRRSTLIQRGEIFALSVDDNMLRFFEVTDDRISGYSLSRSRYVPREIGTVEFSNAPMMIGDLGWDSDRGFVMSTKLGTIERFDWSGDSETIFDSADHQGRIVPWELVTGRSGEVYFVDLDGRRILLLQDGVLNVALSRDVIHQQGFSVEDSIYYRLSISSDGQMVTTDDFAVITFQDGSILDVSASYSLAPMQRLVNVGGWLGLIVMMILLLLGAMLTYTRVLQRRVPLVFKQVLIIVPALVLTIAFISTMIIRDFLDRLRVENLNRVSAMAQSFAVTADPDLFLSIETQREFMNEDYQAIRQHFHAALNNNQNPWNRDVYFALYRLEGTQLYGFMYQNDRIGMFHPFTWFDEHDSVYRKAAAGQVASEVTTDVSGDWMYAVAPVMDADGRLAGMVEVGTDLFSFEQENASLYIRTVNIVAVITAGIIIILVLSMYMILQKIRILHRGAAAIAEGKWDTKVHIQSNDEVYELAATFNQMSDAIQSYMREIESINVSYRRFVPEQFISYIGRPSVLETRLGDQTQEEMTVLFSDIRSFTEMSERMSPKENFDFLNDYLKKVGPLIRGNEGFIDKYIGDAVMALFPGAADNAVRTAIGMKQSLFEFNRERNENDGIDIGIGIHTGNLMLGIIGEDERLQGTVISDNVNMAARLESLTKQMGAGILISGETFDRLENPQQYLYRYLGMARVKGRLQAMRVFEILDGEIQAVKASKASAQTSLEAAVELFRAGNLEEALQRFESVLRIYPQERCAALYRSACLQYAKKGKPEPWTGVLVLTSK